MEINGVEHDVIRFGCPRCRKWQNVTIVHPVGHGQVIDVPATQFPEWADGHETRCT